MTSLAHDRLVAECVALGFHTERRGRAMNHVLRKMESGVRDMGLVPDAWRVTRTPTRRRMLELVECEVSSPVNYNKLAMYAEYWFILDYHWSEVTDWDVALWTVRPGETRFVDLMAVARRTVSLRDGEPVAPRLKPILGEVFVRVPRAGSYPKWWTDMAGCHYRPGHET